MIRPYAVHYPQLIEQAMRLGWRDEEMNSLKTAHDFAMRLFDGLYRGQGMPFLNHVVRTASILMAEKASVDDANAMLLHAAYFLGRFHDRKSGFTPERRRKVVAHIGEAAEALVRLYAKTKFHEPALLEGYLKELPTASTDLKRVLLMRLANELEDYLDCAMAFRRGYPMHKTLGLCQKPTLELARRLDHPQLASELAETFRRTLDARIPEAVQSPHAEVFEVRKVGVWAALKRKFYG